MLNTLEIRYKCDITRLLSRDSKKKARIKALSLKASMLY